MCQAQSLLGINTFWHADNWQSWKPEGQFLTCLFDWATANTYFGLKKVVIAFNVFSNFDLTIADRPNCIQHVNWKKIVNPYATAWMWSKISLIAAISNATFVCGPVEEVLPDILPTLDGAGDLVVVANPARAGLRK